MFEMSTAQHKEAFFWGLCARFYRFFNPIPEFSWITHHYWVPHVAWLHMKRGDLVFVVQLCVPWDPSFKSDFLQHTPFLISRATNNTNATEHWGSKIMPSWKTFRDSSSFEESEPLSAEEGAYQPSKSESKGRKFRTSTIVLSLSTLILGSHSLYTLLQPSQCRGPSYLKGHSTEWGILRPSFPGKTMLKWPSDPPKSAITLDHQVTFGSRIKYNETSQTYYRETDATKPQYVGKPSKEIDDAWEDLLSGTFSKQIWDVDLTIQANMYICIRTKRWSWRILRWSAVDMLDSEFVNHDIETYRWMFALQSWGYAQSPLLECSTTSSLPRLLQGWPTSLNAHLGEI